MRSVNIVAVESIRKLITESKNASLAMLLMSQLTNYLDGIKSSNGTGDSSESNDLSGKTIVDLVFAICSYNGNIFYIVLF